MITLYKIIPGPVGPCGRGGQVACDHAWSHPAPLPRWWDTLSLAQSAAEALAERIGERPQPGHQNTDPLPIIVVEATFLSVSKVANQTTLTEREVSTIWQLADGTWSSLGPDPAVTGG